nr:hypothetical protein [Tanacetum cinerariifolium]
MADMTAPSGQAPAVAPPREVFRMPIPGSLITADIREASYYKEYKANMAKHRRLLADETGSSQDSPALKPAKPARKPKPITQKARINILQQEGSSSTWKALLVDDSEMETTDF